MRAAGGAAAVRRARGGVRQVRAGCTRQALRDGAALGPHAARRRQDGAQ